MPSFLSTKSFLWGAAVAAASATESSPTPPLTHPKFPDAYQAVLTLQLPYAGLDIPLTFQVDAANSMEQIDYYQGLQSDFYMGSQATYKYVFENSVRKCIKNEAPHRSGVTGEEGGGLVHPLPQDLEKYTYTGKKVVGGIEVDRYVLKESHGTTHSMDDHLEFLWDPLLKKPVQWHMHARNRIFGSHTDEYIVKYLSFSPLNSGSVQPQLPTECDSSRVTTAKSNRLSFPAESIFHRSAFSQQKKEQPINMLSSVSPTFRLFARQHGLSYSSKEEWEKREAIFHKNVKKVEELNAKHKGQTTFKLNKFAAQEVHELHGSRLGRNSGRGQRKPTPAQHLESLRTLPEDAPKNFDWRSHLPGSVAPVRDQGVCGSCWAFSLISAVESANYLANSHMVALPEQFVIDCTWGPSLAACDGGLSNVGARTIMEKYGGIFPSAESYGQYLTVDGYCRGNSTANKVGAKVSEFVDIPTRDQKAVQAALLKQPLSVAFNVGEAALFYDSGVLNVEECEKHDDGDLNHAINLVGYGTDEATGLDYWLLRNSWSTYWGDEGYFKVARGNRDCGVSTDAGFPVVEVMRGYDETSSKLVEQSVFI